MFQAPFVLLVPNIIYTQAKNTRTKRFVTLRKYSWGYGMKKLTLFLYYGLYSRFERKYFVNSVHSTESGELYEPTFGMGTYYWQQEKFISCYINVSITLCQYYRRNVATLWSQCCQIISMFPLCHIARYQCNTVILSSSFSLFYIRCRGVKMGWRVPHDPENFFG